MIRRLSESLCYSASFITSLTDIRSQSHTGIHVNRLPSVACGEFLICIYMAKKCYK